MDCTRPALRIVLAFLDWIFLETAFILIFTQSKLGNHDRRNFLNSLKIFLKILGRLFKSLLGIKISSTDGYEKKLNFYKYIFRYLKDHDNYQRMLVDQERQNRPKNLKRVRTNSGCLCFSSKSRKDMTFDN